MKNVLLVFGILLIAPSVQAQQYNLLLSVHTTQKVSHQQQTQIQQFNDLLMSGLMLHHKYKVYNYSPTDKQIGSLLEHNLLSQTALAQPYSLQVLEQVAADMHISYILEVTPFFTQGVIQATVRVTRAESRGEWQTNFTNTMHMQNLPGMRHLNADQQSDLLLALMTDQITGEIGIPTHYAAALTSGTRTHSLTKTDTHTQNKTAGTLPHPPAPIVQNGSPGLRPPLLPDTLQGSFIRQAQLAGENKDYLSQAMLLREAVNHHPLNPDLRIQLITAYQELNIPQMALQQVLSAQALMPNSMPLRQIYGKALLQAGNTSLAIKVLKALVNKNPADPSALLALADAQIQDNHFREAILNYRKVVSIAPASPAPHQKLAMVYALQAEGNPAKYQLCLQEVQTARSLTPPTDTLQYRKEFKTLLTLMDARLRDISDSIERTYQAAVQGTVTAAALQRTVSDLEDRAAGASNFLQNLPTAADYESAQNHYAQAAALLIQSIGSLQNALNHPDTPIEEIRTPLTLARMNAIQALNRAKQLLEAKSTATTQQQNHSYVTQN